jgi:GGDEF domain-containing protein
MPTGLFPNESQNLPFDVSAAPAAVPMFKGAGTALGTGVEEGFAQTGIGIAGAMESARDTLRRTASDISGGISALEQFHVPVGGAATAMGAPSIAPGDSEVTDVSQDETDRQNAMAQQEYLSQFRPDPQTTGTAAQILHGFVSGLTRMAIGGVLGGPVGAAGTVGLTQGYDTQQQLLAAGVKPETAQEGGVVQGALAGAGAMLPGGYGGKLLTRIATGGMANVGQGMLSRSAMSTILDDAGYHDMAEQYRPLDAQATIADLVLGMGFGAAHHIMAPSTLDAAQATLNARHVEESAPGVPVDPASRQAAVANHDAATQALLNGDDVPPMQDVRTVANPAQAEAGGDFAAGVAGEAADAGIDLTQAPARAGERRQDAIDTARLTELRSKGLQNLTPDETREYANLLEADRLAAKVGGRRITGLLSREAYEEQVAAGTQLPHVGYFDLDMFKDINDKFGSHVGDDVIRATGEAAAQLFGEGNAFKGSERAGDEFMVQGNSPEDIQTKMDALRQYLSNHTIQGYDKDGNLAFEQRGVNFSHGIGKDARDAEAAAKLEKQRRAALGLRSNRGAGAAEHAAERGAGEGAQAPGTYPEARLIKPADQLARNLEKLRESNGTDETAHANVRSILKSVADRGGDTAAVERAAIERAGKNADAVLGAAKASEKPAFDVSGLDPETASVVEAAQHALADGDISSVNEDTGQSYSLREEMQRALADVRQAKTDGMLHEVAAACGARA